MKSKFFEEVWQLHPWHFTARKSEDRQVEQGQPRIWSQKTWLLLVLNSLFWGRLSSLYEPSSVKWKSYLYHMMGVKINNKCQALCKFNSLGLHLVRGFGVRKAPGQSARLYRALCCTLKPRVGVLLSSQNGNCILTRVGCCLWVQSQPRFCPLL